MAVSSVCQYDIYVIGDSAEWENTTILELQRKRPGIQCISRNDWIPGKYKLDNLVKPVSTCKIVVVGFTASSSTGSSNYLAQSVFQECLENNDIDEGKLIPVMISKDAKIPDCLKLLTPANGWEDNVYEKLLNALDGTSRYIYLLYPLYQMSFMQLRWPFLKCYLNFATRQVKRTNEVAKHMF
ncbi:uncharacterized protein LOC117125038 [Anneissia japonica]|uniref:uncharacterized protein LOC117125038 n=1 Tax=Anneissia japonica TaxID=1529436 RepID=UPI0014259FF7|nr:uncharacterized protein LOC117125038 [Anneissia japonica]